MYTNLRTRIGNFICLSVIACSGAALWLAKNTNRTMIHRVREIPSNWATDSANQASLLRLRDTKTAENRRVSVISRGANAGSRQALDWVAGGAGFKLKCSNAETYNPIQQSAPQRSVPTMTNSQRTTLATTASM
jgi:hypothetical protein